MKLTPDCTEIEALAAKYPIIPVCREVFADIVTPITLLRKIAGLSSRYCLLESIEGGENWDATLSSGMIPFSGSLTKTTW